MEPITPATAKRIVNQQAESVCRAIGRAQDDATLIMIREAEVKKKPLPGTVRNVVEIAIDNRRAELQEGESVPIDSQPIDNTAPDAPWSGP